MSKTTIFGPFAAHEQVQRWSKRVRRGAHDSVRGLQHTIDGECCARVVHLLESEPDVVQRSKGLRLTLRQTR